MKTISLILFLSLLFCPVARVKADDIVEKFPEWIEKEKIRAGYMYANPEELSHLSQIKYSGLNTIILKTSLQRKYGQSEIFKNVKLFSEQCKKLNLHCFVQRTMAHMRQSE